MPLARYLPAAQWLRGYGRGELPGDLIAAGIVTIMLIPQSLAYARERIGGEPSPRSGAHSLKRWASTATNFNPGTSRKSFAFPVNSVNLRSSA